eukprot:TRINITY_DN773_c0_g1_i6.p1 TRINITY_DN773_c0_g1~~TRINITY_DN773_c0_g1_i6.p1  ORF type:complete len:441 (-),score=47.00 TRINITY_DN773_c0_g1_i6:1177-2499(-)
MTRYGFSTLPAASHINSMMELAFELRRRGHEVVFITVTDFSDKMRSLGFETVIIGAQDIREGDSSAFLSRLGELDGLAAVNHTVDYMRRECEVYFRTAPDLIRAANIDLFVIDEVVLAMPSIAEFLGIPFVVICTAFIVSHPPSLPPVFSHRIPSNTWFSRLVTFFENRLEYLFTRRIDNLIRSQRQEWNLLTDETFSHPESTATLAWIIQFPKSVDFAERCAPGHYHYIGRLAEPSGEEPLHGNVSFPFEKLDGRPLIYASFGTIQNRIKNRYQMVIDSCRTIDAQLILALGDRDADVSEFTVGDAIVVPFAPQEKLVSMAALVITHGGNNTATMAMSYGVPMVVIPVANDQPGVGARVKNAGLGVTIIPSTLTMDVLRRGIVEVLNGEQYQERSRLVKEEIKEAGGVVKAASIVEKATESKAKVLCAPGSFSTSVDQQ